MSLQTFLRSQGTGPVTPPLHVSQRGAHTCPTDPRAVPIPEPPTGDVRQEGLVISHLTNASTCRPKDFLRLQESPSQQQLLCYDGFSLDGATRMQRGHKA